MTEPEWLAADDPGSMLLFLRGKVSDRKFRLFAVACCRNIPHLILGDGNRTAIETAERYAEGVATREELSDACDAAAEEWYRLGTVEGIWRGPEGENPAQWVANEVAEEAALQTSDWAAGLVGDDSGSQDWQPLYVAERTVQVRILRDIVGNPFQVAPPIDLSQIKWNDSTIRNLAQAAYDERTLPSGELDPAGLAILSDALEEAGCTNEDLLTHLRDPGPHVRGCWALDLVLGKE